jgi:hypothetical protein
MGKASHNQIKTFFEQISHFTRPEELFGDLGSNQSQQLRHLETTFKSLIKLYHPDQFTNHSAELYLVTEIAKLLNDSSFLLNCSSLINSY